MSRQETCEGVIGGLMALGLAYGSDKPYGPRGDTPQGNEGMFKYRNKKDEENVMYHRILSGFP